MFKKFAIATVLVIVLVMGAVAVHAQQGGGHGQGGPGNQPDNPGNGLREPRSNGQNGAQRNGQQRSQMNQGAANGTGMHTTLPPASTEALPQEIIDLMIAGWLDEQHAYAAYESIMEQFGEITPFTNIQQAEVQHAAAWEFLFDRYDVPVPDVPTFDIPTFTSPQEACALGAEAEIANFALYDTMLEAFEPYPDIYQVALALRDASEFNHLPAFQNCAGS